MSIPDEIKTIVDESGNSFHCRVTNYLKEKGWHTLVSPYYMDGSTNKPREIDLIAERHWIYNARPNQQPRAVIIKLFIECKYISQPNVFWFSDKDIAAATDWVVSNTPLSKDNTFTKMHHYLSSEPKVAKLFASKNKPGPENEVIYRALNQSLNAMVYLRRRESIIPEIRAGEFKRISIEMPVVLCNSFDNFYRVEMDNSDAQQKLVENFQLEINYAYLELDGKRRNDYFLLDIVNFGMIDSYLNVLEADKEAIFKIF
ncbi:MAG TPA: hypothetical protein PKK23_19880 [Nitrospirales bacterium]|nr:hypothetical protein [Nitrospirales bacterium]